MTSVPLYAPVSEDPPVSLWRDAWQSPVRNKLALVGLAMVLILAFAAAFGPMLTPYDFLNQDLDARNLAPSLTHLFGTNDLGRDVFGRMLRETVWIDFVLVFGSMVPISWPPYARLVRAQVLSIRSRPYINAARALGLTNRIILTRYVVPNAIGPLIVSVSAGLGTAMVLESAFSFLGFGGNPPTPSRGNMILDGLRVWQHYPHLLAAPAIVLGLATVAFSFLGDGLNDAINPSGSK